jgi:hypothetical protein
MKSPDAGDAMGDKKNPERIYHTSSLCAASCDELGKRKSIFLNLLLNSCDINFRTFASL